MNTNIVHYVPKSKKNYDPTAWELYRKEHPDWPWHKQLQGFVILTLAIMAAVLGGIWTLQHLEQLIAPIALVAGLVLARRYK